MEDYSINISVKKSNISNETAETVNIQFSHYKSMGTLSCHSNQSSYPTGIKNTVYVDANVLSMFAKFQLHPPPPLWFLRRRFFNIFTKINRFLPPRQPIKFNDLNKSDMKCTGLLNKHFCKKSKYPHRDRKKCQFPLFPLYVYGNYKLP